MLAAAARRDLRGRWAVARQSDYPGLPDRLYPYQVLSNAGFHFTVGL